MILDEITQDRDAYATSASLSYSMDALTLFCAYGDFRGDADGSAQKAHVQEHDVGFEYGIIEDKMSLFGVFVHQEDRESTTKTDNDYNHFRLMLSYNF